MVMQLPEAQAAEFKAAPFTYREIGLTAGEFPTGFAALHRVRALPPNIDFRTAAARLMTWQMHARAGLRVATSSQTVEEGVVVVMGFGVSVLRLSAPCRVVYVVDDAHSRGFAYGTLPGHPESGEERFVVRQRPDGCVELAIDAFSRPATPLAKLAGPIARWAQNRITDRYLGALDT